MSSKKTSIADVKVDGIKVVDISPKLTGDAAKLLPTVLKPQYCEFNVRGANAKIANGIRRVVSSGVKAIRLTFDLEDYETNDPFAKLNDLFQTAVRSIPIKQNTPRNTVFSLNIKNNTEALITITAGDIQSSDPKVKNIFDDNTPLLTLESHKYLKIKRIFIDEGYEYEHGTFCLSSAARSIPLDQTPYNMYTKTGVSASVADPREHKIAFETHGQIDPLRLVLMACDEIIERLEKAKKMLYTLTEVGDFHQLTIDGEDYTIGMIVFHTVCDLYPKISAIAPDFDPNNKVLKIRLRAEDPQDVLSTSIIHAVDILSKIKQHFV